MAVPLGRLEAAFVRLRERTGIDGITCRRRVAGVFCNIVTPTRIPKEAINTVGKELGEHLNVFISQASKR